MYTPDEIKKGLECREIIDCYNSICPYFKEVDCLSSRLSNALALIRQLERERDEALEFHKELVETNNNLFAETVEMQNEINALRKELEQVKRERDAAVEVMSRYRNCDVCTHTNEGGLMCTTCKYPSLVDVYPTFRPNWQWRGERPQEVERNCRGDME